MTSGSLGGALNPLGLRFESSGGPVVFEDTLADGVAMDAGVGPGGIQLAALISTFGVALEQVPTRARPGAAADTFRATIALEVAKAIAASAASSTAVADVVTRVDRGVLFSEVFGLRDAQSPSMRAGAASEDTVAARDQLFLGIPALAASGVAVGYTLAAAQTLTVLERLGLAPALLGAAKFGWTVTDRVRLVDGLANFFGLEAADAIAVDEALDSARKTYTALTQGVTLEDVGTPWLLLSAHTRDALTISDTSALQMLFGGAIHEGVTIQAGYLDPSGAITTWAVNTRSAAVSEYLNYEFNSFAMLDGRPIGASDTGLYELLGDDDDGDTIVARLKSGFLQFGGTHLSRLSAAYIATRGEGDFVLRIITGDGATYNYATSTRNMRSTKVHMGKGQRARYFAFELISAGQDFDLDTLEFVPVVVQRRV